MRVAHSKQVRVARIATVSCLANARPERQARGRGDSFVLRSAQDECSMSGVLVGVIPMAVHEVADPHATLYNEPAAPGADG